MALKSGLFMPTATGRTQDTAHMAASHVPYDSLSDAEVMLRAGTDDNARMAHGALALPTDVLEFTH